MKLLKLGAITLATILAVAVTSSAPAAPGMQIERMGNVFTVSVCGKISASGTAHCYAKVVTDARGNVKEWTPAAGLTRNAVPAGFGPTDLRQAYGLSPASGAPGSGPTIAIVDAYGYANAEKDLNVYRAQYGLGSCTTANGCFKKVNQN